MKRLLILLSFITFSVSAYPQIECPQDSIGGGGAGVGAIDQSVIQPSATYCTEVSTTGMVLWELPTDFNGHVYLHSSNGQYPSSIQVVKDCRFVMMDTCLILPTHPSYGSFDLSFAINGGVQLFVSGQSGDTISIDCKSTPSPQEQLDIILLDLNTCNAPVGIEDRIEQQYTNWLNIFDHTRYKCEKRDLPTSGIYWNYNDAGQGRKVIVTK